MLRKECVAMILAGGQGSRLGVLTRSIAKPAVPFGGKYRLIDFTLSNCYNSGVHTVGVLTQYQPFELHCYIGIGSPWDLDRLDGGVFILPPFVHARGGEWYKGTANAIFQNIVFIDQYDPDYVLVLSGDHIYKMDYSLMIEYHKHKGADATIAVIEVPCQEASRFGIMNTDTHDQIIEFEEKPKEPKSNLASMGVYVFSWEVLKKYLESDEKDRASDHDFGKNVIPTMLRAGQKMMAYRFGDYWKDVGTVESLWEANMDLLTETPQLDLHDPNWRIYSVNPTFPPQLITVEAKVTRSLLSVGCLIYGQVENSVLFAGVSIAPGATVKDSVLMPGARIGTGAVIERSIIGSRAIIEEGCQVGVINGKQGAGKITVVGEDVRLSREEIVSQGSIVE